MSVAPPQRTVVLDEPILDQQSEKLGNAIERAERAEAELARLKAAGAGTATGRGTTGAKTVA